MKSIVYQLDAPYTLVQQEIEIDETHIEADEIVAETEYSAISTGTEIAAWVGMPPLRPSRVYPRLMGYCNLARVLRVGSAVSDIAVGDYILTHQSHRSAFKCPRAEVLLYVQEKRENVRKKLSATYLYHLGYAALLAGEYTPGHELAIVGMGTLGVTTASLSKAFGASPLLFTNQASGQTRLRKMGFRHVLKKAFPEAGFKGLREGVADMDGVDIAINTSNQWDDYRLCLQLTRKGGQLICLGFPGRGESAPDFNPLDSQYFYDKQLSIKHCGHVSDLDLSAIDIRFTLKRNMRYLARLIMDEVVNPADILSAEAAWSELAGVYSSLAARDTTAYSAVLDWRV